MGRFVIVNFTRPALSLFVDIFSSASDDVCSHEAEWCPDNYYCDIASKRCRPCSHVCDVFRDDKMCDKYCDGKLWF